VKKDLLSRLYEAVTTHYENLNRTFVYPYPSAKVAAIHYFSPKQTRLIRALVRDVHFTLTKLFKALPNSSTLVRDALIGSEMHDVQRLALTAQVTAPGNFPFCYRIDALWTGETFKVIEINNDNAGGLEDSFDLRLIYQRHLSRRTVHPTPAIVLAKALKSMFGTTPGRIVYTDGICEVLAFRLASILSKLGVPCAPLHLNELSNDRHSGFWIYRHFLFEDLFVHDNSKPTPTPTLDAVEGFLKRVIDGKYVVYNALRDRLLFDKRLLAQKVLANYISKGDMNRFLQWVAPTQVIDTNIASKIGEPGFRNIVIKSARGMGGKQVYTPGKNFSHERIADGNWVEQTYVEPETIQILRDGGWRGDWNLVHGIFVIGGHYAGNHIRVASGDIINVSGGGGMIPNL
jgi:hypothetical protein